MRKLALFSSMFLALLLIIAACQKEENPTLSRGGDYKTENYIVILKGAALKKSAGDAAGVEQTGQEVLAEAGIAEAEVGDVYSHVTSGFSTELTAEEAEALKKNSEVEVIKDELIQFLPEFDSEAFAVAQKKMATAAASKKVGTGRKVWVVSTGITSEHEQLNIDQSRSINFSAPQSSSEYQDCHGWGTALASVIGGSQVGSAPGVPLIGVRVLNCQGSGHTSDILDGLDHVSRTANAGDVVMLGYMGPKISALSEAVDNLAAQGLYPFHGAGNDNTDVIYSHAGGYLHPNVTVVGALEDDGSATNFTNYGNQLDYMADGRDVPTCWYNSTTATNTLTGTSLAAAKVAGLALTHDDRYNWQAGEAIDIPTYACVAQNGMGYNCVPSVEPNSTDAGMIELKRSDYEAYGNLLREHLDQMGTDLRSLSTVFDNETVVKNSTSNIQYENPSEHDDCLYAFDNFNNNQYDLNNYDPEALEILTSIENNYNSSISADNAIQYLNIKFDEVYSGNIEKSLKEELLIYIMNLRVSIEYIQDNRDILIVNSTVASPDSEDWWENWGKCAIGTLGSVGTGALHGGLAGAGMGTVTVPVIGTIGLGVIGTFGGAIFGGMVGAATFC